MGERERDGVANAEAHAEMSRANYPHNFVVYTNNFMK
jgi:hypothetical protein